jgi:phosphoglycerate dehydrogenase-like enzyme
MMKVAILDDYQNVSLILGNFEKLKKDFFFQVFNQPFQKEDSVIAQLKDFEVLLVMRERTPITKKIISNLKNLKLIITIHTVSSDRTKNLITKKDLELMKETAFLINTSRGPIVNEFDLVEALEKNIIAGAGLDVYDIEPLPENHKLRFLPNALLLPHLGYVTKENYELFYSQMFENLEAFKKGKPIRVIQMLN